MKTSRAAAMQVKAAQDQTAMIAELLEMVKRLEAKVDALSGASPAAATRKTGSRS